MKTTKMVMGMLVAAAMTFTGCMGANKALGEVPISYDKADKENTTEEWTEATATVDFKNENDAYARGMLRFNNKKKGITAKLSIDNISSNTHNPGLVGLVFDMKKNKDNPLNWDFCVLGVNNEAGTMKTYISYYQNVSEANFDKSNFGLPAGTQTDIKDGWGGSCTAYTDAKLDGWYKLNGVNVSNGTLSIIVDIEALKKSSGDDGSDGYAIRYYKTADTTKFKNWSSKTTSERDEGADVTVRISRDDIGSTNTRVIEEQMGFYANVYGNQTLKGTWNVLDMKHEPNTAKLADAQDNFANTLNIKFID